MYNLHLIKGIHLQDVESNPTINYDMPDFDVVDGGGDDERQESCSCHVDKLVKGTKEY